MSIENIENKMPPTPVAGEAELGNPKRPPFPGIDSTRPPGSVECIDHSVLDDLDKDTLPGSRKRPVWEGWNGTFVMLFGVLLPVLTIAIYFISCPKRIALVTINHPLETLAELLLVIAVPVINYRVWSALRDDTLRFAPFSRTRPIYLGLAFGSSLITSVCFARMIFGCNEFADQLGTDFDAGYLTIAVLSLSAGFVSAYLINEVRRLKTFANWRITSVFYAVVGLAISALTVVGAEARPWCIRFVERMAVANSPKDRKEGLYWLRQLNPEKELRLECSDSRAAGLCGLFMPLTSDTQKQLYFALTGKPFSYKDCTNNDLSSLPDDYLGRNVVGEKKPGLSLIRSSMAGAVHPGTLSSTIDWTLVFKNDTMHRQEARAEIRVPQGAVVTGLTSAGNGQVRKAFYAASERLGGGNCVDAEKYSPTLVTELGHNRKLVRCFPIMPASELKVTIRTVAPLNPDGSTTASFILPRFVATNFDVIGEKHSLRLRSPKQLTANFPNFKRGKNMEGDQLLSGSFTQEQAEGSNITVMATGSPSAMQVLALDKIATKHHHEATYAAQSMVPVNIVVPRRLAVVIDGSADMQSYIGELRSSLSKLPANIRASLIVASQEQGELTQPVELSEGLKSLDNIKFVGGQDNLKAVAKATELAGQDEGGAVLWIHGPQSVENRELYLVTPDLAKPTFYELQVDSGDTDTLELFRNHPEIGPFVQVPNCGYVSSSIEHFLSKWKSNSKEYVVDNFETYTHLPGSKLLSGQEANEVIALRANAECLHLLASKQHSEAARIAVAYGLVTPISSAIIADSPCATTNDAYSTAAYANVPRTQGATNGTIGPQENAVKPDDSDSPQLQGASSGTIGPRETGITITGADNRRLYVDTNGSIGPQMDDATYVTGVNTSGTVRVNNLANLEAMVNLFANGLEILAIAWGGPTMIMGFMQIGNRTPGAMKKILFGATGVAIGLATPGSINWLLASARDANLFS